MPRDNRDGRAPTPGRSTTPDQPIMPPARDYHEVVRLTTPAMHRLAAACDQMGEQATPSQIAATEAARMASQHRLDQAEQSVIRGTCKYFLEQLQPHVQALGITRGDFIRALLKLQEHGLADDNFQLTVGGQQTVHDLPQGGA